MSLLKLVAESVTFSMSNGSSGDSRDLLDCLITSNRTVNGGYVGIVVSGLVCSILLMLTLVFELFYICRYKTTFLQRLFVYFTIAAAITEVTRMSYLVFAFCKGLALVYFTILQLHTYFIELLLIGSISATLLSKMYKHRASRQVPDPNTEYMLCCCAYKKSREVTFCLIVFITTLTLPVTQITTNIIKDLKNNKLNAWITFLIANTPFLNPFLLIVLVVDLVLMVISIIVLINWLCKLRRRKLLQNKIKLVCGEIMSVVGLMIAFVELGIYIIAILVSTVPYFGIDSDCFALISITISVFHCYLPLMLLGYIRRRIRREAQRKQNAITTTPTTAPPSTRVSLPTDTAAHAPNFLSPSTAESTEVTPLVGDNSIQ